MFLLFDIQRFVCLFVCVCAGFVVIIVRLLYVFNADLNMIAENTHAKSLRSAVVLPKLSDIGSCVMLQGPYFPASCDS